MLPPISRGNHFLKSLLYKQKSPTNPFQLKGVGVSAILQKPGNSFAAVKYVKNNCGRTIVLVKMQVTDLHVYLKCYSSTGFIHAYSWCKATICFFHKWTTDNILVKNSIQFEIDGFSKLCIYIRHLKKIFP